MRIAIDARAIAWAGVGRYITNLVQNLIRIDNANEYFLLISSDSKGAINKMSLDSSERVKLVEVEGSYYSWMEQTKFVQQLNSVKADLYHFTHFNVPVLFMKPFIVTIHDLIRFVFPGQTKQGLFRQLAYEFVFRKAVTRANGIICVSATTERDLFALPTLISADVSVVYEAVSADIYQGVSDKNRRVVRKMLGFDNAYILYVGVWMSHKNLPRIIEAYKMLKADNPLLKLALTGSTKPGHVEVESLLEKYGVLKKDVVFLGFVPAQLLGSLYGEAECLLLPSLYEGFGLPALEAASVGCPVVTSNVSSMPEIMGDAAIYVNPENVSDIARGVREVLNSDKIKANLVKKGIIRAGDFSWERCAADTLAVYNKVKL